MTSKYGKILKVVMNLVQEAGALAASRNTGRQQYTVKSNETDLVTSTDKDVENILVCGLSEKYPSHKIISEEMEPDNKPLTNDPTWLIDPVDGTMNFIHSFPHFCVSIALVVEKTPVIGIVYNPALEKKFTAIKGEGAFLNDCKISVSGEKDITKSMIMAEFGSREAEEKLNIVYENFEKFSKIVHGIRTYGSAALNLSTVALGGADAYCEMGIHHWDIIAGVLIVREAGGTVIDPAGGPFDIFSRRVLAASSMELACAISENLVQYYPEPKDK